MKWLIVFVCLLAGCDQLLPSPVGPTPDPIGNDTATAISNVLQADRVARAAVCEEIANRLNEPEFDPKDHWNDADKKIANHTSDQLRKLIKARLEKPDEDAAWREIGKGYGLR